MADDDKRDGFLGWLGITDAPQWQSARPLGRLIGVVLTFAFPLLFAAVLIAAFAITFHTIRSGVSNASEEINLGAGALIAAPLGSPFLIWSTFLKNRAVLYQKEGHITAGSTKQSNSLERKKPLNELAAYNYLGW